MSDPFGLKVRMMGRSEPIHFLPYFKGSEYLFMTMMKSDMLMSIVWLV